MNPVAATMLDAAGALNPTSRPEVEGHGRHIAETSLRISGMHCAACADTVRHVLEAVAGVTDVQVSAAAQCATVRWDRALTRASLLVQAIESAGYQAAPDTAAAARALRKSESRMAVWRLFVAAFCAMQIMMFAAPAYVSAPGELAADHKRLLDWGAWLLTLPVLWFSAAPFFAGAWRALRHRRIGMDLPVAIGIAVTFIASSGAAYDPGGLFGAEVYFDTLAMFVSFLLGGRWLEMRARHRAEVSFEDATQALPRTALRLRPDGSVEVVPTDRLCAGNLVRAPVGEAFAADGVLAEGSTQADESMLTGESRPVTKTCGDAVSAGSVNLQAPVLMEVEHAGPDTRYEAIVALMRAARTQRPAMLASADRWAAPFLWAVLLLAAGAGAAWSVIDPPRAVWVVVSVLIVTCPCALSLAAPSALLAAARSMARHGVLLRRLDAIQGLARMQTLFVDKTGTLTEGRQQCAEVQRLDHDHPASTETLQAVAASLAGWSNHPLSAALRGLAPAVGMAWQGVREMAGQGLEGTDATGGRWRLGAAAWAGTKAAPRGDQTAGALTDAIVDSSADSSAEASLDAGVDRGADGGEDAGSSGGARTWLAHEGRLLLCFVFDERLRDGALDAVQALQAGGVQVRLLSGDDPRRAQRLAALLGLSADVKALGRGLTPSDKLAAVRAAQQRGEIVGMLGDGINDAPVLAQADVSIAMGAGALIARTQADGVLVSNRLGDIVGARDLAVRTLHVVRQNFVWAALYNAACVPLAIMGWLPPWAAGLGMATSSVFVVTNSLRLARRSGVTAPHAPPTTHHARTRWTSSTS